MDQPTAFAILLAACIAAILIVAAVYRYRRLRATRLMHGLLEDYFQEKIGVEQLGQRARESVGRRFVGGNESFAEVASAFQHAVNTRLPPRHSVEDESKLLRMLAAARSEFGLTERYKNEGWRAGRE